MQGKQRLERYLRDNAVTFQVRSHPEVFTAQEVAGAEHVPGREVGKVVMVTIDDKVVMVVVTAPAKFDLDKVALALGTKDARPALQTRRRLGANEVVLPAVKPDVRKDQALRRCLGAVAPVALMLLSSCDKASDRGTIHGAVGYCGR
jgi:hypothetical protein